MNKEITNEENKQTKKTNENQIKQWNWSKYWQYDQRLTIQNYE